MTMFVVVVVVLTTRFSTILVTRGEEGRIQCYGETRPKVL